jgi:CRP-like cAMP-binding protein
MPIKRRAAFNPKSFLAKVGEGRSIGWYRKDQIVFAQGDPADAVFYIQSGGVAAAATYGDLKVAGVCCRAVPGSRIA